MRYSVIIPLYNAQDCLEEAIRSVCAFASDPDFEIIAVDDGSRDNTRQRLDALALEIPQLRVFTKENQGPAEARNFGLEQATGEYILFCDSDDRFVAGGAEKAVQLCREADADVLVFGFLLSQDGVSRPYCYPPCRLTSSEDWRAHLSGLYGANMLNQVWGKVFRAELISRASLRFPNAFWGEDRLFFFEALSLAERVAVTDRCFYDYIQHKNSLISRFLPEKGELCERVHRKMTSFARAKGAWDESSERLFSYMYVKSLLSALATLYSPSCRLGHREKRAYVKRILSQESLASARRYPADCGKGFAVLAFFVRTKNVTLNLLAAWGVHLLSHLAPKLLQRAKHIYNKEKGETK